MKNCTILFAILFSFNCYSSGFKIVEHDTSWMTDEQYAYYLSVTNKTLGVKNANISKNYSKINIEGFRSYRDYRYRHGVCTETKRSHHLLKFSDHLENRIKPIGVFRSDLDRKHGYTKVDGTYVDLNRNR